jgi:D-methionine transport system permease protein
MKEIIERFLPNVYSMYGYVFQSVGETAVMVLVSGVFSLAIGTISGIVLVVTGEGKLYENKTVNTVLSRAVNTVRSIPFVIIIALLVSFTRFLTGTSIGIRGAVVPMIVGNIPFVSRITEQALWEVDNGVIEAARSMGLPRFHIVVHVLLPEALPGLVRSIITGFISLLGLSAMAGTVGGGGIGAFAIRYGYQRYMHDITLLMVVILLVVVNLIQGFGNKLAKQWTH